MNRNDMSPRTAPAVISRRTLLKTGAMAGVAFGFAPPMLASVLQAARTDGAPATHQPLATGWEYYQGPLDPRFQVWNSEELVTWSKVTVPHCFNAYDACDPDTPAYRGQGCYRMKLPIANPYASGRTLLHFEGAGQSAKVYVGDELAGEHVGGYDEFLVDITDSCRKLKLGEPLRLAVLCDNGRDIDRMPSDLSDFTLYGGLYRRVHLVYVPAVSLASLHTRVIWEPGQAAKISVTGRLYGLDAATGALKLNLKVTDPQGKGVLTKALNRPVWNDEVELASFEIAKPDAWSPASPNLYRCELTLGEGADKTTTAHRFGIRHTRFEDHGPFYLNGDRLLIRGTQRHEDHAGYAAAMPEDLIREEMRLMKAMGANMVRLAHYQQSPIVLDLCDELGIMVWEEIPWCRSGVESELFAQRGREKLTAMIDQHSNHPSVILWGLGNEDDWPGEPKGTDHAAMQAYMTTLQALAHQLDPTRLTGYRRSDFLKNIPDVYSPSIWAGWYSGTYVEYKSALEKGRASVPRFLHVEWGADSHAGRHAEEADPVLSHILTGKDTAEKGLDYKLTGGTTRVSKDGEWSETYACDLFDWYLKTQDELPWLTGSLQWIFKDFTTPLRVENPVPRVNQKGLLTRDMKLKEGYFVFQSYWAKEPMVRVYGHDWPVRWGKQGQKRLVRVYSNCASVELFLNGKSVGAKKRDPEDFPAAGLRWEIPFISGRNKVRAVAQADGKQISDEVEFMYQTESWGAPARLKLTGKQAVLGKTIVEATLHDASGIRCLDSRAVVRFSVAGDGKLNDNLGTPTGSRVVQLYNGRAEITVSHNGAVTAGVQSTGITPAFLSL